MNKCRKMSKYAIRPDERHVLCLFSVPKRRKMALANEDIQCWGK
jgi:hypothetical protein